MLWRSACAGQLYPAVLWLWQSAVAARPLAVARLLPSRPFAWAVSF